MFNDFDSTYSITIWCHRRPAPSSRNLLSKTKTMILNHHEQEYPSTIASLSGEALENVKVFRYLGCDIKFDEPSTGEAELNLRTDAATGAFYGHSRNMMNHKIYMKTRVMMLNSLVRIDWLWMPGIELQYKSIKKIECDLT